MAKRESHPLALVILAVFIIWVIYRIIMKGYLT